MNIVKQRTKIKGRTTKMTGMTSRTGAWVEAEHIAHGKASVTIRDQFVHAEDCRQYAKFFVKLGNMLRASERRELAKQVAEQAAPFNG